jgi:hypothetical protein
MRRRRPTTLLGTVLWTDRDASISGVTGGRVRRAARPAHGCRPSVRDVTSRSRTLWESGEEPGHEVAALALALLLTAVTIDLALADRLGLLFDLVFITVCVRAALMVRPADFFTVGVLPPLAMLAAVALLAVAEPAAVARPQDGVVQATVSGLSGHAATCCASVCWPCETRFRRTGRDLRLRDAPSRDSPPTSR